MSKSTLDDAEPNIRNTRVFLAFGGLTDLATRLASPQVVLPWIYTLIGGPLFLFGLLVPSVRFGSMASQMAAIPILRAMSVRKWLTAVASATIGGLLALLCIAVLELPAAAATVVFFVCTLGFGICNGIIQLTSQDVMAKTIRHDRLGRVVAMQSSIGGALTLAVALAYIVFHPQAESEKRHLIMIGIAALIWTVAAMTICLVKEAPRPVQARRSLWSEVREGASLYRTAKWFRRYTLCRILFLSVGLATPFYSIHAATLYSSGTHTVSIFVLATGAANMLSGLVWGRLLVRDPRIVLGLVALVAAAAGGLALTREEVQQIHIPHVYAIILALLALSEQGLTQASRTYVALMAPSEDRPLLLASNNALLGVMAIGVSGVLGVVAHLTHIAWALCILIVVTLCAGASAWFLTPHQSDP